MIRIICYLTLAQPVTLNSDLGPSSIMCWWCDIFFFFFEGFPQNLTHPNGCAGNIPDLSRRGDGGVSSAAAYSQPSFLSWEKIYCGPPVLMAFSHVAGDLEGHTSEIAELGSSVCESQAQTLICFSHGPVHVIHRLTAFRRLLII